MKKLLIYLFLLLNFGLTQPGDGVSFIDMGSTGSKSVSGLPYQPAGVIGIQDEGGSAINSDYSLGFSDMTDAGSLFMSNSCDDGQSTGDCDTRNQDDKMFLRITADNTSEGEASFTSQDAGGFTMNVTDASTTDANYLYFGGGLVQVKVGSFSPSGTTGNQSITSVGFIPNAVLFMGGDFENGWVAGSNIYQNGQFGFMADNGGEFSISFLGHDNRNAYSFVQGSAYHNSGSSITSRAEYVSMDSDGFTVNWTDAEGSARDIAYIAIGGVQAYADTTLFKTSVTSWGKSGFGFQPDFIIGAWSGRTSPNSGGSQLRNGIGFATGTGTTEQAYMTATHRHAQNPTVADHRSDQGQFLWNDSFTGGTNGYVDIQSFDPDGITFYQGDAIGSAEIIGFLAIKILEGVGENAPFFGINF